MYHQIHMRMILNGKKDEAKDIAYSKILSWHSAVRTEEKHDNHILLVGFSSGIRAKLTSDTLLPK